MYNDLNNHDLIFKYTAMVTPNKNNINFDSIYVSTLFSHHLTSYSLTFNKAIANL